MIAGDHDRRGYAVWRIPTAALLQRGKVLGNGFHLLLAQRHCRHAACSGSVLPLTGAEGFKLRLENPGVCPASRGLSPEL
jgi:hypothetical protein